MLLKLLKFTGIGFPYFLELLPRDAFNVRLIYAKRA